MAQLILFKRAPFEPDLCTLCGKKCQPQPSTTKTGPVTEPVCKNCQRCIEGIVRRYGNLAVAFQLANEDGSYQERMDLEPASVER